MNFSDRLSRHGGILPSVLQPSLAVDNAPCFPKFVNFVVNGFRVILIIYQSAVHCRNVFFVDHSGVGARQYRSNSQQANYFESVH